MESSTTSQWVFSQEIPSDVVVEIGETRFPLHKSILVAKSGYLRKMLLIEGDDDDDLPRIIDLSYIPGGSDMFEKAAKFCYGVNFEINIHNVAALHCAAEYLEMTEFYCHGNLVERTEEFLSQVALKSPSGTLIVLMSCNKHLQLHPPPPPPPPQTHPVEAAAAAAAAAATHIHHHHHSLNILLQRCVDVASSKACNEANFPSPSPANWWIEELTILDVYSFKKIINSMKSRGAKPHTLAIALKIYTEKSLGALVRGDHHRSGGKGNIGGGTKLRSSDSYSHYDDDAAVGGVIKQRDILETIVSLLPPEKGIFPLDFLCYLLRSAIFLDAGVSCKNELENKISGMLEQVNVDDLLVLSFTLDGEKLFDLESVRRVISGFVDKEKSLEVFSGSTGGGFKEAQPSMAMQKVANMVDAYLGEIATYTELSISKFNGIANLVPKAARKVDDHLYRSIDIYLKAHPGLDEIEREKVCSVMDPFKLSYEARVHASQNKRLPVQIVLHALYYDQLKLRSTGGGGGGGGGINTIVEEEKSDGTLSTRTQLQADVSLVKENEELRTELMKMKLHISYLQKNLQHHQLQGDRGTTSSSSSFSSTSSNRPINLFYSVSKKLGKLKNSFRHGSKDTLNMDDDDDAVDVTTTMPRRGRRFSIS